MCPQHRSANSPGHPGDLLQSRVLRRVVRRKAQWVEVKTQPEMDPAFCYFCFLTKVGMALALRPTHPRGPCAWQARGRGWTPSDGITGGGSRTTAWGQPVPCLLSRGVHLGSGAESVAEDKGEHRHGLAAVITLRKEVASLAFGRMSWWLAGPRSPSLRGQDRVFCPRRS